MYQIFYSPEVSKVIKLRKLQWRGHDQRVDDIWIPERVFGGRPKGRRAVRKLRKRLADSVQEDSVSLLGFQNWMTRSLDRDFWRKDIMSAKVQNGLQCLGDNEW